MGKVPPEGRGFFSQWGRLLLEEYSQPLGRPWRCLEIDSFPSAGVRSFVIVEGGSDIIVTIPFILAGSLTSSIVQAAGELQADPVASLFVHAHPGELIDQAQIQKQ